MIEGSKRADVLIFTALGLETKAVRAHLTDIKDVDFGSCFGALGLFGQIKVGVIEVGAGNSSAAAAAASVLTAIEPPIAAFVGVAGGIKDVALGDVVVASKVYGYESGKVRSKSFASRPSGQTPDFKLEQSARMIRQRTNWLDRIDFSAWDDQRPNLFVEPIAAGEKVVASSRSSTARLLQASFSDAVAVEMEGRGFLEAVRVTGTSRATIVRGISDLLSNKEESDAANWQPRAASAAAAATFEMLHSFFAIAEPATSALASEVAAEAEDYRLLNGRSDLLQKVIKAVQAKSPRLYTTLLNSLDLARDALAQADEANVQSQLAAEALDSIRPKSVALGAPNPVIVRSNGFGIALWNTGDLYVGAMASKTAWGVGVYKIYAYTEEMTADSISYFRGDVQPKNTFGPLGVYEFANGSLFAGEWSSQRPRRGYMSFVSANAPFDFYFGDMRQYETKTGNLWKPGGNGIAISVATMTLTCGAFDNGLAIDANTETFSMD